MHRILNSLDHPFPSRLSFILKNPIRRYFDSPERVLKILSIKRRDVVVDFGCGPGFYTIPFAKIVGRVIAIDVQTKMLEKAEKYAKRNNVKVEFFQSDGRQIPLPNNIADLIFLSGVFHELDEKHTVLKELARLLKQSGKLAIKEKTRKSLSPIGPPIVKISEITSSLKSAGLTVSDKIELGNDTIVVGKHPSLRIS